MASQARSVGFASGDIAKNMVVFKLDDLRYALRLSAVERIVRMVEISPLPKAPDIVLGVVNSQGEVLPVMNIRTRFRLPERRLEVSDHLVVARTPRRKVALAVDAVIGVVESSEADITVGEKILPILEYVEGVVTLEDGLIFIHNLDSFLSLEEEQTLGQALTSA